MVAYNGWMGAYHVPDTAPALSTLAEASDTFRTNRQNRAIGEAAAGGRLSDAAGVAFKQGNVKTGAALQELDMDRQEKIATTLGRFAQAADTPEKWNRFLGVVKQRFPGASMDQYADFSTRDAVLAEFTDPDQAWKRELAIRGEIRDQEAHDLKMSEARSKPPSTELLYDDAGAEYKAVWNPEARRFEKVGGTKAKADAPKTESFFDEKTGTEYKAQWNPETKSWDRVGGSKAPSGTKLSVGPDGQVTFESGTQKLGTAANNENQKKALNAAEVGSRIQGILENFDPNDQTIFTRLNAARLSGQAKFDPSTLGKGERAQLEGFSKRKSAAISNINRTLNELSGAAVSPQEEQRLRAEMPDPGTGIFDGDDPISFEAKAKAVIESMNRALARYSYYQATGLPQSLDEIPLNNVRQINGEWFVLKDGKAFKVGNAKPAEAK